MEIILNKLESWEKESQDRFDKEMNDMDKYFNKIKDLVRNKDDKLSEL